MSRLAKKPINISKSTVSVAGDVLTVKGAKATLTKSIHPTISIEVTPEGVVVTPKNNSRLAKALTGTYASHLRNMIKGVETPFVTKMILEGVGYKVELKGTDMQFTVGKSHLVKLAVPADVKVAAEKNVMTLESANKESVGQFAAIIRAIKPPEPYLGKGIRYEGEVIRRKQGKKAV